MSTWTCHGPVRGACRVTHPTMTAALDHCAQDAADCARLAPGAYSDRRPVELSTVVILYHGYDLRAYDAAGNRIASQPLEHGMDSVVHLVRHVTSLGYQIDWSRSEAPRPDPTDLLS